MRITIYIKDEPFTADEETVEKIEALLRDGGWLFDETAQSWWEDDRDE